MKIEEVEKTRELAVYLSLKDPHWYMIREIYYVDHDEQYFPLPNGERREKPYGDFVRVSEILPVTFVAIKNENVIEQIIGSLNQAEKDLLSELNAKLAALRERRAQLLALTHQPESV